MDIKDLKVFHTIAKEESIAKASRILYMTPQGISKIVKNLEAEMGCRLFTRNKSGMQLTESGRRFLEYADKDIEDYYQVKKDILHIFLQELHNFMKEQVMLKLFQKKRVQLQ